MNTISSKPVPLAACSISAAPVRDVQRHHRSREATTADDLLAVEEPLEIRVNTRSVSVTMRTPGHDEELAAGFLLTEGLIRQRADLAAIGPCKSLRHSGRGNIVNATLAAGLEPDFARLTRHVFASSSCGLCGKASIQNLHQQFPPIEEISISAVTLDVLGGLPFTLRRAQETFARTGGLHAAGVFDFEGNLIVAREDVGRHNAVDKVIGHGLLHAGGFGDRHILLVSGRASFEIVQKALAARFPVIAAVSAPSSLAVEFARANRQTIVGFLRDDSLNIYTHAHRVRGLLARSPSRSGRRAEV